MIIREKYLSKIRPFYDQDLNYHFHLVGEVVRITELEDKVILGCRFTKEYDDIDKYFEHLKKLNKKTSTISRNLATIRSFYTFLVKTKKIKKDPTVGVQSPKVEKKVPSILTAKEVELLLEQPSNVDLKGISSFD